MFRKNLIAWLLDRPMTAGQLARATRQPLSHMADDLEHFLKSLKHSPYQATISPAQCRKCGFTFPASKLLKPSRCPQCRSTWLSEPTIAIHPK